MYIYIILCININKVYHLEILNCEICYYNQLIATRMRFVILMLL